jgi:hypothetical protein
VGHQPNTSAVPGSKELIYMPGGTPQYQGSNQYFIEGTGGLKIEIGVGLPTGGDSGRTYQGVCWAAFPGKSPTDVARALKLFEVATLIEMKVASSLDNQVHYWAKQLFLSHDGNVQSSTGAIEPAIPDLSAGMKLYRQGKSEEAIKLLRNKVAQNLGMTPDAAQKLAAATDGFSGAQITVTEGDQTYNAGGRVRFTRLGVTREKCQEVFGKNVIVAHTVNLNSSIYAVSGFLSVALPSNGALIAKHDFNQYVFPWKGTGAQEGSTEGDHRRGGAHNIFMALRDFQLSADYGVLCFDISLILRDDVYITGINTDGWGDPAGTRAHSLKSIHEYAKAYYHQGRPSATSYSQITARHEVDLQQYLYYGVCSSAAEVKKCIALCKAHGMKHFYNGRTPEQVFVTLDKVHPII